MDGSGDWYYTGVQLRPLCLSPNEHQSVNWEVCNTTSRKHCCHAVHKTNVLFSYKHESDEGLESLPLGRGDGQNALLTSCSFCCVASTTLDARGV